MVTLCMTEDVGCKMLLMVPCVQRILLKVWLCTKHQILCTSQLEAWDFTAHLLCCRWWLIGQMPSLHC